MKKSILISIASLFALLTIAQSPNMFNYQAVVRNSSGDILISQDVSFEIVILQTSPAGTPVYTETHNTSTNEYGLVTLKIGNGVSSDDLATIDWGADEYYMKISLDAEGGTNYEEMGTTQILSVPYSLYSETAENVPDNSITSAKIQDGAALAEILDDDGSGTGLNADLLDGESMDYYLNASNINAGTLNTSRYSAYTDLFAENRIAALSSTTHATNTYVDFVLPDGWTIDNTRIVSVEIYRNSLYWSGLSFALLDTEIPVRYFMWDNGGTPTLRVMYPNSNEFKGRSIRVLLFRID
jgi:hypothetical protein